MLEVSRLDAFYGRAQILHEVGLRVGSGEAVALLGRNGAGKSTTLRAIMAQGPRRTGEIRLLGADVSRLETHELVQAGIGYAPEDRRIFTDLTVMENLEVGRRPARPGHAPWTIERLFALFPNLAEMRQRRGGQMSGGEQQMLTLARTLMGNPLLLLLDEPSEGLAPRIVEQIALAVMALKTEGLSILLCEQNLHFARLICDRTCVMARGRMVFEGSFAALEADPARRDALLSV
ncbi:MAG: ABC transporter ATP-binding protein [Rhizobiales bacterium 24-66-13]|nr:MAG: ABC transporter ATP-binding protein [Rhizobiales bacterium 35-66-30]OYZ75183.1 MAG: ABC transporter ATP-binding protein [Rhizobiales bacterium 24-66-13]OZB03798.1 MAG: ABC transporter ATP-binding protein [Rhizobiales bacterium 39-66-18]HQS10398.1 ABC transporter ATP-binding protein [Xanthobacteraceae bacterium]HQS47878.1 ABC transporter ATP-binding protein [Xanthobacteraceae bacterium]